MHSSPNMAEGSSSMCSSSYNLDEELDELLCSFNCDDSFLTLENVLFSYDYDLIKRENQEFLQKTTQLDLLSNVMTNFYGSLTVTNS